MEPKLIVDGGKSRATGAALADVISVTLTQSSFVETANVALELNGISQFVQLWENREFTPSAEGFTIETMVLFHDTNREGTTVISWAAGEDDKHLFTAFSFSIH